MAARRRAPTPAAAPRRTQSEARWPRRARDPLEGALVFFDHETISQKAPTPRRGRRAAPAGTYRECDGTGLTRGRTRERRAPGGVRVQPRAERLARRARALSATISLKRGACRSRCRHGQPVDDARGDVRADAEPHQIVGDETVEHAAQIPLSTRRSSGILEAEDRVRGDGVLGHDGGDERQPVRRRRDLPIPQSGSSEGSGGIDERGRDVRPQSVASRPRRRR